MSNTTEITLYEPPIPLRNEHPAENEGERNVTLISETGPGNVITRAAVVVRPTIRGFMRALLEDTYLAGMEWKNDLTMADIAKEIIRELENLKVNID